MTAFVQRTHASVLAVLCACACEQATDPTGDVSEVGDDTPNDVGPDGVGGAAVYGDSGDANAGGNGCGGDGCCIGSAGVANGPEDTAADSGAGGDPTLPDEQTLVDAGEADILLLDGGADATPEEPVSADSFRSYDFQIFGPTPECGEGARGRLDLWLGSSPRAVVTFEWERSEPFSVEATADAARLFDGTASVAPSAFLKELTLSFDAEGEVEGIVDGFVMGSHSDGMSYTPPEPGCDDALLTGTVTPDGTAPRGRIVPAAEVEGGLFLPWNQFLIRASEPLPAEAAERLGLFVDGAEITQKVSWTSPAEGWSTLYASTGDFSLFEQSDSIEFRFPEGVVDLADNTSVAASTELAVVRLGALHETLSFGPESTFGSWGQVEVVDASVRAGVCEGESCAMLHLDRAWGAGPGIAARLAYGGLTSLAIRHRWLLAEELDEERVPAPLLIVDSSAGELQVEHAAIESLERPIGEYTRATAWETAILEVAPTTTELGVSVQAEARWIFDSFAYAEPTANLRAALVVEWVRLE